MPREKIDKPLSLEEVTKKAFTSGFSGMSAMII